MRKITIAIALLLATHAWAASKVTRYLIVSGENSMGSWDSSDQSRYQQWRNRYGSHYAWFKLDGREYIVDDRYTLAELDEAMAPQRDVNRRQSEVNSHQSEVNRQQSVVNDHQSDVNRAQDEVNRRQDRVNHGDGDQSGVNRMQSEVNARQHEVNAEQEKVNQKQSVVNQEQQGVNQLQTRVSAEIQKALDAIFDSAVERGLAHEVR